jgi:DNA-binding protein YbaB
MSTPLRQQLDSALADLRVQQTRLRSAAEELAKTTTTAASKDRAIEATVDSQGKLTAIKLKGTGFRKLAPAELAARVVETVRSAQDAAARKAVDALMGMLPADLGLAMGPSLTPDGSMDIDAVFEAAARAAQEPLFATRPESTPKDTGRG